MICSSAGELALLVSQFTGEAHLNSSFCKALAWRAAAFRSIAWRPERHQLVEARIVAAGGRRHQRDRILQRAGVVLVRELPAQPGERAPAALVIPGHVFELSVGVTTIWPHVPSVPESNEAPLHGASSSW